MAGQQKKNKKRWLGLVVAFVLVFAGCMAYGLWENNMIAQADVSSDLNASGTADVKVDDTVVVTDALVVNGDKTISGEGVLKVTETITVKKGAALTIDAVIEIDTGKADHGIVVEEGAALIVKNGLTISNCNNGIQNKGTVTVANVTIKNCKNNGVYNTGIFNGENIIIQNVGNAGMKNDGGTVNLKGISIEDTTSEAIACLKNGWVTLSGDNAVSNSKGSAVRTYGAEDGNYKNGVTLTSKATLAIDGVVNHGINNKGSFFAEEDSTISVKNITGSKVNAINNNGGNMTLGDVTVDGVYVTIDTYTDSSDNNAVKINTNSGNGIMNSGKLEINGDVTIQNIFVKPEDNLKDNTNGSGVVVKNGGKITGKGNITIIGSDAAGSYSDYLPLYNGVYLAATTLDISGDIKVSNTANQGIYVADKGGKMEVDDLTVENAGANGIYLNHTNGVLNASGTITINGAKTNGINNNSGADITAHYISVSNITGTNAIANGTGGTIDVRHDIIIENISGSTSGKTVGNGLSIGSGIIEVGGDVKISGITTAPSDSGDNSSNNGIYGKGSLFVDGDVIIDGVEAGHGIFLTTTGIVHSCGDVTVKNITKQGKQGIYVADATGKNMCNLTAVNVTVTNVNGNGILVSAHLGNTFVATGTVKVSEVLKGRGISNQGGTMSMGNVEVSDIQANYNAIENKGSINITGEYVTVNGITNGGNGIYNEGAFLTSENCTTTITNIKGAKSNGVSNSKNYAYIRLGKVVIDGVTATSTSDTNVGNGIYNAGTLQLDGEVTIRNLSAGKTDNSNASGIVNTGTGVITGQGSVTVGSNDTDAADKVRIGVYLMAGSSMDITGDIAVYHPTFRGIFVAGANTALTADDITVKYGPERGITVDNAAGKLTATGTITIDTTTSQGLENRGIVKAANLAVSNTKAGLWIRDGLVEVSGDITVTNCSGDIGIITEEDSEVKAGGNITVTNTGKAGMQLKKTSKVTATGAITVDTTGTDGIQMQSSTQISANTITVNSATNHAILMEGDNKLQAETIIINTTGSGKNGFWITSTSDNLSVTVTNLVLYNCGGRGVSSKSMAIEPKHVSVGTLWYAGFSNYKSDNVSNDCFGAIYNQLPPAN